MMFLLVVPAISVDGISVRKQAFHEHQLEICLKNYYLGKVFFMENFPYLSFSPFCESENGFSEHTVTKENFFFFSF